MLRCELVCKSFGGNSVLHQLSVDFKPGVTAVLGDNGSGKSTLLNVISAFSEIDSGRIEFNGEEISRLDPVSIVRRGISRTFQDSRVVSGLKVHEHVALGANKYSKVSLVSSLVSPLFKKKILSEKNHEVTKVMSDFSILPLANKFVGDLSIGQKRLVSIATCFATDASCFLLDEPTSGLDAKHSQLLLDQIRYVEELGKIIILVEHNRSFVDKLSPNIVTLESRSPGECDSSRLIL